MHSEEAVDSARHERRARSVVERARAERRRAAGRHPGRWSRVQLARATVCWSAGLRAELEQRHQPAGRDPDRATKPRGMSRPDRRAARGRAIDERCELGGGSGHGNGCGSGFTPCSESSSRARAAAAASSAAAAEEACAVSDVERNRAQARRPSSTTRPSASDVGRGDVDGVRLRSGRRDSSQSVARRIAAIGATGRRVPERAGVEEVAPSAPSRRREADVSSNDCRLLARRPITPPNDQLELPAPTVPERLRKGLEPPRPLERAGSETRHDTERAGRPRRARTIRHAWNAVEDRRRSTASYQKPRSGAKSLLQLVMWCCRSSRAAVSERQLPGDHEALRSSNSSRSELSARVSPRPPLLGDQAINLRLGRDLAEVDELAGNQGRASSARQRGPFHQATHMSAEVNDGGTGSRASGVLRVREARTARAHRPTPSSPALGQRRRRSGGTSSPRSFERLADRRLRRSCTVTPAPRSARNDRAANQGARHRPHPHRSANSARSSPPRHSSSVRTMPSRDTAPRSGAVRVVIMSAACHERWRGRRRARRQA